MNKKELIKTLKRSRKDTYGDIESHYEISNDKIYIGYRTSSYNKAQEVAKALYNYYKMKERINGGAGVGGYYAGTSLNGENAKKLINDLQ